MISKTVFKEKAYTLFSKTLTICYRFISLQFSLFYQTTSLAELCFQLILIYKSILRKSIKIKAYENANMALSCCCCLSCVICKFGSVKYLKILE